VYGTDPCPIRGKHIPFLSWLRLLVEPAHAAPLNMIA
jgi:hypothetical protein